MGSAATPKTSEIYEPVANEFIVKGVAVSVQSLHGIQFPAHKNPRPCGLQHVQREIRFVLDPL